MGGKVYGLLGRTLTHSWSVPIHAALGRPDYRLIELAPEELEGFLRRTDIGGLNVTIPYKRTVMAWCDEIDPAARAIGSVNTLVRRPDGKLWAYNTDAAGFCFMAQRAGIDFAGAKTIILGSGGASLTAQFCARSLGARSVSVISRSGEDTYETLSRHEDAEIVVNTTPVGMYPNVGTAAVELRQFPRCRGVLDVIYNPRRTALLAQAEERSIPCSDGLPMLVAQAAEAEALFFGAPADPAQTERILSDLRRERTNLVLVGMPGCGKTTVGRALAKLTGRELVDLDAEIVRRAGKTIPALFADEGEAAFRALEREETARAGKESGRILVTGGGVVLDAANRAPLRQNGRVYWLRRDLSRLSREGRPLSAGADLAAMYERRAPLYARFADAQAENNGGAQDVAAAIWRDFCEHSGDERAESEHAGGAGAGDLRPRDL